MQCTSQVEFVQLFINTWARSVERVQSNFYLPVFAQHIVRLKIPPMSVAKMILPGIWHGDYSTASHAINVRLLQCESALDVLQHLERRPAEKCWLCL
jgi:hypothetical protein